MSGSSILTTGFSCPRKGSFYACAHSAVRFVGCCTTDPCLNGGVCAAGDLYPTTFSADSYDEIPPQNCSGSGEWFTCKETTPPFLGCCVSNPCQASGLGGCPSRNLRAARLADDDVLADPFLGSSSTARPSSTRTAGTASTGLAASPTASDASGIASPGPPEETSGLATGAIAGLAVGGFALCAIIAFLAWCLLRQRRRTRAAAIQGDQMTVVRGAGNPPPYDPYKGLSTRSSAGMGYSPSSPPMAAWSPQSPQPSEGWASPGPERAARMRPLSELAGSEIGYSDLSVQGSSVR